MIINIKENTKGMAAIIAVVLIGTVSLVYAKNVSSLGLSELASIQALDHGEKAMAYSESCLEEAIYQIKYATTTKNMSDYLNIGNGSCGYEIVNSSGEWDIVAEGEYRESIRRISATISTSTNGLDIEFWELSNK